MRPGRLTGAHFGSQTVGKPAARRCPRLLHSPNDFAAASAVAGHAVRQFDWCSDC